MKKSPEDKEDNNCFVIMPISTPEGYANGHFDRVYDDIIKVACKMAGFIPSRADDVKETHLIHLNILKKLIESPLAICDLSSRNPNVLFELGLRQAFDKPTVLIQEVGTADIFDVRPLKYTEYRSELNYREVLEDQVQLSTAITATKVAYDSGEGINSLINLLSLSSPAKLKDGNENNSNLMFQLLMSEVSSLKNEVVNNRRHIADNDAISRAFRLEDFTSLAKVYNSFIDGINADVGIDVVTYFYNKFKSIKQTIIVSNMPSRYAARVNEMSKQLEEGWDKYLDAKEK